MIIEDYVSFETAKLLKEKGFDEFTQFVWYEKCPPSISRAEQFKRELDYFYLNESTEIPSRFHNSGYIPDYIVGNVYSAPTLQMAMKWLREVHGLHIRIDCIGKENWAVLIQSFDGKEYPLKEITIGFRKMIEESNYPSYEVAVSAAIEYCLLNLNKTKEE